MVTCLVFSRLLQSWTETSHRQLRGKSRVILQSRKHHLYESYFHVCCFSSPDVLQTDQVRLRRHLAASERHCSHSNFNALVF